MWCENPKLHATGVPHRSVIMSGLVGLIEKLIGWAYLPSALASFWALGEAAALPLLQKDNIDTFFSSWKTGQDVSCLW